MKHNHYHWKIFIPLALLLCSLIATLVFMQQDDFPNTINMWAIKLGLTVITIILLYLTTRRLSKNIMLLRDFANQVANNEKLTITPDQFPSDELGEISQQIIKLYKERGLAIEKSEQEHNIAVHATEEKGRLRRELTNNINHELKTPIGIIKGYIDTILETPDMDAATQRHFIEKTHKHVARLCTLLNDISTITRLDEASIIPTNEVNLHDIVYAISNDIKAISLTNNMTFIHNIPLNCPVKANQGLLGGAILNLIRNAATYSHGTEMGLLLKEESNDFYTFVFYDNGVGIEEKHLQLIFERFYRVDVGRSRKTGGTGLGLPIVKSTIKSLGGDITAKNRPTGGLEFTFTLPKWVPQSR